MSKPIDSPYIAWFDLETTGSRDDDAIMEIGFVLTDRDLNEVEARKYLVVPHDWNFLRERMDDVVVNMHEANGLMTDIILRYPHQSPGAAYADAEISSILRRYGGGNHVPLAGSGVGHFDRKYIKRELRETNSLLSYWTLDIGVMRRWLTIWGIETPGSDLRQAKTHRALDDIREHIAETKVIRDTLQQNAERAWMYEDLK